MRASWACASIVELRTQQEAAATTRASVHFCMRQAYSNKHAPCASTGPFFSWLILARVWAFQHGGARPVAQCATRARHHAHTVHKKRVTQGEYSGRASSRTS